MKERDDWPGEGVEERRVRDAIWKALPSWTGFLIGIDGRDGTGKSTLARYLAWQLGLPTIELDLFLEDDGKISHRYDDIRRVARARLQRDRPLIIEGVCLLRALDYSSLACDFLVTVDVREYSGSETLRSIFEAYEEEYRPQERSSAIYQW